MAPNINLSWDMIVLYLVLGALVSWGYFYLLMESLKMIKKVKKKGLFLFFTTMLRLALFIFLTLVLTGCHPGKFIYYIIGFILTRFICIKYIKHNGSFSS